MKRVGPIIAIVLFFWIWVINPILEKRGKGHYTGSEFPTPDPSRGRAIGYDYQNHRYRYEQEQGVYTGHLKPKNKRGRHHYDINEDDVNDLKDYMGD